MVLVEVCGWWSEVEELESDSSTEEGYIIHDPSFSISSTNKSIISSISSCTVEEYLRRMDFQRDHFWRRCTAAVVVGEEEGELDDDDDDDINGTTEADNGSDSIDDEEVGEEEALQSCCKAWIAFIFTY